MSFPQPSQAFHFHGTGREYFKIWIINLALTLATLGIYAAWAKVRSRKYFYQSTELNGNRFDYHANPKAILKGNLVVASVALCYGVLSVYSPQAATFVVLSVFALVPFLMVSSLRFHLANCSYRGLRFEFKGAVKSAYGRLFVALLMAIGMFTVLVVVGMLLKGIGLATLPPASMTAVLIAAAVGLLASIALLAAVFIGGLRKFTANNAAFGNSAFKCDVKLHQFGMVTVKSSLLAVLVLLVLGVLAFAINSSVFTSLGSNLEIPTDAEQEQIQVATQAMAMMGSLIALTVLGYLTLFAFGAHLKTSMDNLVWNNMELATGHRFTSTASPLKATWIVLSNLLLIVLTLGLYIPFARVRMAKYRLSHMAFVPASSVDDIIRAQQHGQKAYGDSMADALGMEIGI
jgi:uncharacterized membrane protein YjgN (DUF898 family)